MARHNIHVTLPDNLLSRVETLATLKGRSVNEILTEWVLHTAETLPLSLLPDDQLLAHIEARLSSAEQRELSLLLDGGQQGCLGIHDEQHLDRILNTYRNQLRSKAEALKVAHYRRAIVAAAH